MSIKKESLAAILVKIGAFADNAKALDAISSEAETDVSIPEGTRVYTKTEWEGDGSDKPGVLKTLQGEGEKIGRERTVKEMKERTGLTFEGKSPEKFIEEYKVHVLKESGQTVDEKVKARDKDIQQLKQALEQKTTRETELVGKVAHMEKVSEIRKHLPKGRDPRFSDDQYITLLASELDFTTEEDKPVVKKAGEILKGTDFAPLAWAKAIEDHFTANKWTVKTDEGGEGGGGLAGRGGGNGKPNPTGMFKNTKEVNEYCQANNIEIGSQKSMEIIQKAIADNPNFDAMTIN